MSLSGVPRLALECSVVRKTGIHYAGRSKPKNPGQSILLAFPSYKLWVAHLFLTSDGRACGAAGGGPRVPD